MSLIKLTINRQTKALSVSPGGAATFAALPPLYPETQQFSIQVIDPPVDFNGGNTVVDCSASTLRLVVAAPDTVTGDGPVTLLSATYEAGWTWDITTLAFLGNLNLATSEIIAALGSNSTAPAVLEINLDGVVIFGAAGAKSNLVVCAKADGGSPYIPLSTPFTSGALQIKTGVGGLTLAGNVLTVTGLGFGSVPSRYDIKVITPAGSGFIDASFIIGSGTANGFSAVLSAIPPNDNYFITFTPYA